MAGTEPRQRYHHGDLRNALIDAAATLAERGGPESATLRAAAREVGVSATAAYRHFAGHDELVDAIRASAMRRLSEAMAGSVAAADIDPSESGATAESAVAYLNALGRGYVGFATSEPGMFRTAFFCPGPASPDGSGPLAQLVSLGENSPYLQLSRAVDQLVTVGVLAAEERPGAEIAAWAGVHGLSELLITGPLRGADEKTRAMLVEVVVRTVSRGLRR